MDDRENEDGTWTCRVCGFRVSAENAAIFIAAKNEGVHLTTDDKRV